MNSPPDPWQTLFRGIFAARINDRAQQGDGRWAYGFVELFVDPGNGALIVADPGRSGTPTRSPAYALDDGAGIFEIGSTVHIRMRGSRAGEVIWEILCGASAIEDAGSGSGSGSGTTSNCVFRPLTDVSIGTGTDSGSGSGDGTLHSTNSYQQFNLGNCTGGSVVSVAKPFGCCATEDDHVALHCLWLENGSRGIAGEFSPNPIRYFPRTMYLATRRQNFCSYLNDWLDDTLPLALEWNESTQSWRGSAVLSLGPGLFSCDSGHLLYDISYIPSANGRCSLLLRGSPGNLGSTIAICSKTGGGNYDYMTLGAGSYTRTEPDILQPLYLSFVCPEGGEAFVVTDRPGGYEIPPPETLISPGRSLPDSITATIFTDHGSCIDGSWTLPWFQGSYSAVFDLTCNALPTRVYIRVIFSVSPPLSYALDHIGTVAIVCRRGLIDGIGNGGIYSAGASGSPLSASSVLVVGDGADLPFSGITKRCYPFETDVAHVFITA